MKKLKLTDTTFRDAHQSLIATRMKTEEMLPIVEKMDQVGFHAMEIWGGATFDTALRFLDENPWDRVREIKKRVKNTKLQMLLRGQNLLGYRHYADDVVEKFVEKSIENGIDIIRIFDGLNDTRNIKKAAESTKKYGGHCQLAMCYALSPVHTVEYYKKLAVEMVEMGADSIAIKDMSGILRPYTTYQLVKELKNTISVPIEVHTHSTAGLAEMTYIKAIEAGADIVDVAISPFSGGASQPAAESLIGTLGESDYQLDINENLLKEIAEYFKPIRKKYLEEGILNPQVFFTEPKIFEYQLPGGMLSNLLTQLRTQEAEDKYEDVLRELPRVRKDMGYPPLVTPISQIIGGQALFNVLMGERYKNVSTEIKDYIKGMYGRTPAPISPIIVDMIIGKEERFTGRPADLIEPEFEKLKKEIGELAKCDEDVLMYAMFPRTASLYLERNLRKQIRSLVIMDK